MQELGQNGSSDTYAAAGQYRTAETVFKKSGDGVAIDQSFVGASAGSNAPSASSPEEHWCQWVGCEGPEALPFPDGKSLFDHLVEKHSEFPPGCQWLLCWWEPCEHFAPNRSSMISHMRSHVAYYPAQCKHCTKRYKRFPDMRTHQKKCAKIARAHKQKELEKAKEVAS
jgi:hypothetical protein